MDKITDRLQELKETGKMVITPNFVISYNPFKDTFIMDVPDNTKCIWLNIPQSESAFSWDVSCMYPVEVKAEKDYSSTWKILEPYTHGATIDLLPTFTDDEQEYVWFDVEEKGMVAVLKNTITTC